MLVKWRERLTRQSVGGDIRESSAEEGHVEDLLSKLTA
jgi:hypothetical protein